MYFMYERSTQLLGKVWIKAKLIFRLYLWLRYKRQWLAEFDCFDRKPLLINTNIMLVLQMAHFEQVVFDHLIG
jgi:hypothetical protein